MTWKTYIVNILTSILINYKSWILLGFGLYLIGSFHLAGIITFLIGMISSHWIHYWHHFEYSYPHNIVHDYHHRYNLPFNHIIQLLLEFVSIVGIVFAKEFWIPIFPFLSYLDEWMVIFYYLFYTTIHNVNYTIFHVNRVHETHHRVFIKNMGPDICDIVFGTKYCPEEGLENTDHYIPNIIGCTLSVLLLKFIWGKSSELVKQWLVILSQFAFYGAVLFLICTSIVLYMRDIDQAFERDVNKIKGRDET